MSDLAKKLRDEAAILPHELYSVLNPVLIEAADEIERLRAAAERVCWFDWSGNDSDAVLLSRHWTEENDGN